MDQPGGGVDICPVTKEAWEARAETRKAECGGLSVYHCLPDSEGRKWEKCVEKTLVDEGNCPFFTSGGYFDWKSCNSSAPSCPNSSYVTNEVYKYPFCFGNNTPNRPLSEQIHVDGLDSLALSLVIIGVVVVILLLLGAVILRYRVFKRRRRDYQWRLDGDEFLDLHKWLLSNEYDDEKEEPDLMKFQLGKNVVEIARVEKVNEGKRRLLNADVRCMVVIGDFGNSVSSTSRFILTECTKILTDWKCEQYKYTDVPETVTDKTMLYVHGWFGSWNDDLCSLDEANKACRKLKKIKDEQLNVKIIIGIRSDLDRLYRDRINDSDIFTHQLYLDSSNTDAEYSNFFNKFIKEPSLELECPYISELTLEMIKEGNDKRFGMPLKLTILANHHDLISNYIKEKDILKVMKGHFTDLAKEDENVYKWLAYICLKGEFSPSKEIDNKVVDGLGFKMKSSSFAFSEKLERYVRMRTKDKKQNVSTNKATYVFINSFYYICAFHSLYDRNKCLVMSHCIKEVIFQLVRPKGYASGFPFIEVEAESESLLLFRERVQQENFGKYEEHPLMTLKV